MALCKFRKVKYKLEKASQEKKFFDFDQIIFYFKKIN